MFDKESCGPMQCSNPDLDRDHNADCCCRCIRKLVESLEQLHHHRCSCSADQKACCNTAIALVIQAIELELGCLRSCCK